MFKTIISNGFNVGQSCKFLSFVLLVFITLTLQSCKEDTTQLQNLDTEKPVVAVLYPNEGIMLKLDTVYLFRAQATDNTGISKVEFILDSKVFDTSYVSPYQYLWNTLGQNGDHIISASAYDASGNIGLSSNITFSVNTPPSTLINQEPVDAAAGISIAPTLRWSCNDLNGDVLTYDVYIGTSPIFGSPVSVGQYSTFFTLSVLLSNTTYYWEIIAKDSKGGQTTGVVWSFTTRIELPDMVFIDGGIFQMGGTYDTGQQPIHSVSVPTFYIGITEVTQKKWREIVQWKQGSFTIPINPAPSYSSGDSLPVERVSWDDIQIWLGYLNEKEGLFGSSSAYRLPSEAEWEYAARGGTKSNGFIYSGDDLLRNVGWWGGNSNNITHTISTKKANELGLFDMSGNVSEWCQDYFHNDYTNAPTDGSAWKVQDNSWPNCRVLRGGSFDAPDDMCSVRYRYGFQAKVKGYSLGFRIARSIQ